MEIIKQLPFGLLWGAGIIGALIGKFLWRLWKKRKS